MKEGSLARDGESERRAERTSSRFEVISLNAHGSARERGSGWEEGRGWRAEGTLPLFKRIAVSHAETSAGT